MAKKRGKFSLKEDQIIVDHLNDGQLDRVIYDALLANGCDKEFETVLRRIQTLRNASGLKKIVDETQDIRNALHSKEYWV